MDVVIYSGNVGKLREYKEMMTMLNVTIHPPTSYDISTNIPETGTTFIENAIIKARDGARQANMPCIADDSGLLVDCLHGAPGLYSSRFAGEQAVDESNTEKLLQAVADFPESERHAQYYCCIVFLKHAEDPRPLIAEGCMHGQIISQARGHHGFGYDPVFFLPERNKTCAELLPEEKHAISHRGLALKCLAQQLIEQFPANIS